MPVAIATAIATGSMSEGSDGAHVAEVTFMRMYKAIALVVLGATFSALTFAAPALAELNDSGFVTWASVATMNASQGTSPHGGYQTNTVKCAVCHAVHQASGTGEILLRSTVAEACTYCHIDTSQSSKHVYLNQKALYTTNDAYGHQFTGNESGGSVECRSCHQVHAATDLMPAANVLRAKLLQGSDVQLGVDPEYDPRFLTAPTDSDGKDLALTKWCTRCHKARLNDPDGYGYYANENDDVTHVMTNLRPTGYARNSLADTNAQVAWAGSAFCQSCHIKGYGTADWPHYVTSKRFLVSSASSGSASYDLTGTATTHNDGVCLRCHRDATGLNGVGKSY